MHEERVPIRWRDVDAYGHVNNAVYLTYLEEARDALVDKVLHSVGDPWDFVLAHVGIDYRSELAQADGVAVVRCRLGGVGRSSFSTREQVLKADGTVSAEAESVVVARDRHTGTARPLTDDERSALERELAGDPDQVVRRQAVRPDRGR